MRRLVLLVLVLGLVTLTVGPADAVSSACPPDNGRYMLGNPPCYDWQGTDWTQTVVTVPSHAGGAALTGTVFRPATVSGRLPGVAILHGLGGKETSVWWAARALAGDGYIAVTVSTASNSVADFHDAVESMVDLLSSMPDVDASRIGIAGHSAGARAVSNAQDVDPRVKAVVAYDNLTTDQSGDSGTYLLAPQCTTGVRFSAMLPITPRVPAMGLASDDRAVTCPENGDPDIKKAAWSKWRAAGLPTVELVVGGANHLSFDQDPSRTITGDAYLQQLATYTRAWFDRYLRGDRAGLDAVLAEPGNLSTQFRSAAFVPGEIDDGDLTNPG